MEIKSNYAIVLENVKDILTVIPEVEYIEPTTKFEAFNLFSQTVLQGGSFTSEIPFWTSGKIIMEKYF